VGAGGDIAMRSTYDVLADSIRQCFSSQAMVCCLCSGVDSSGNKSTFRNRRLRISASHTFFRRPPLLGLEQERVTGKTGCFAASVCVLCWAAVLDTAAVHGLTSPAGRQRGIFQARSECQMMNAMAHDAIGMIIHDRQRDLQKAHCLAGCLGFVRCM
jgi:hypothetical protein